MKYHEIISALTEEPLLITPAAHSSLVRLFNEHRSLPKAEFQLKREGVDFCGNEVDLEQMEVINGIAHIPIGGPIGYKLGKFEKGAGAVDSQDIMDELDEAEDDDRVQGILLDIDSPGGMVTGTPECADRILRCNKPVFAFTAGGMCSAAYWLGVSADRVFATRSSTVGCIGVYVPFIDSSKAMEQKGYKADVIASGKYKGLGYPGTSLSQDQRDFMQGRVDEIAAMFYTHIQSCMPDVDISDMQGQFYTGETALGKGMIHELVSCKDDVLAMF